MAVCVLWISSHVADGRVGNSIAVFALQRLGVDVVAVPTVLLPTVPGPGRPPGSPVPEEIFRQVLEGLAAAGTFARLSAVHAGYLRTPGQVAAVVATIAAARAANPGLLISVDPVLGDEDKGLYIPRETAEAVKTLLVPQADLLFPNAFELEFLTGRTPHTLAQTAQAARTLSAREIVCTSARTESLSDLSTAVVLPEGGHVAATARLAYAPNGTGDLLSALYLGRRLLGQSVSDALKASVAAVYGLILETQAMQADRLPSVEYQDLLVSPTAKLRLGPLVA